MAGVADATPIWPMSHQQFDVLALLVTPTLTLFLTILCFGHTNFGSDPPHILTNKPSKCVIYEMLFTYLWMPMATRHMIWWYFFSDNSVCTYCLILLVTHDHGLCFFFFQTNWKKSGRNISVDSSARNWCHLEDSCDHGEKWRETQAVWRKCQCSRCQCRLPMRTAEKQLNTVWNVSSSAKKKHTFTVLCACSF